MPDLLLELLSEEIPARMQQRGARELERLLTGALSDRGLLFEGARAFAGPRRLTLAVAGLPPRQPDVSEERKGPRVGAPEKAVEGFLRSAGVTLAECAKQSDAKGEFYVAVIRRAGRPTEQVLADVLPEVLAQMVWPKSMRWVAGNTRWVRPLHAILCTSDGEIVAFEFAGVASGNRTRGHRFLAPDWIEVRRFEDYREKLARANVILEPGQRREIVLHEARQKTFALGLELIEDEGLLDEIAGLVEWPVPFVGRIDDAFMDLPPEVMQTSMRTHQKFFATRVPADGRIANRFVLVANIPSDDGGREIVAGNERVLRARLSDARFFWDRDRRRPLAARLPELGNVVFHARAGTMLDRAHRIRRVSLVIARLLRFDPAPAARAGLLAKTDLVSGMVGEFPELQGAMGRYYALHDGEGEAVANAIGDHYRPLGPSDRVPAEPTTIAVALADKIDSLAMLWRAGERATGSKDPFALRRAGLGIIRIILENGLRLPLSVPLRVSLLDSTGDKADAEQFEAAADRFIEAARSEAGRADSNAATVAEILDFLADRLKFALRGKGVRHDLIDAVFSIAHEDDITRLVARIRALGEFVATEDGANLLAAYRRAANIVRIEGKRDQCSYRDEPDPALLEQPEEKKLFAALVRILDILPATIAEERFGQAMTFLAGLREPVDRFFEKVTVNAPTPAIRRNRLLLLARMREAMHGAADFSRIEG
ncbi:MAG: glycine--tRNA ligase subunit beta [Rhizomicrobium sp.]